MSRLYWLCFIIILIALDQYSKYLTEAFLPLQEPIAFLPFIDLYRTYNFGVAFSMLAFLNGWPLNVLTVAIIGFISWLWLGLESDRRISSLGFALVIGGAIGNLIDRVRFNKVIDMVFFHIDSLNFQFAVFNVADTFITLGAMAIILDEFLKWRSGKHAQLPDK